MIEFYGLSLDVDLYIVDTEYMKMPYGLANAPVLFQRIIAKTFKKFFETGDILVFINDILILSKSFDRGLTLLREVLSTLTNAGFSVNSKKSAPLFLLQSNTWVVTLVKVRYDRAAKK